MRTPGQRCHRTAAGCVSVVLLAGLAAAQPPFRVERNVTFLEPHRTEKADLYIPDAVQPGSTVPAIVVIHGGGWRVGDKASPREVSISSQLAGHGYIVMSINYLLTGDTLASFPTNIQDCKQAVRWLRKNAATYSIDPDHIGAVGSSAGGHLAALLATSGPEIGLDPDTDSAYSCRIQAVVLMYPHCASSWERGDPPVMYNNLTMFESSRTADPDLWYSGLPANHLTADDPPVQIFHGTVDQTTPLYQSTNFQEQALSVGVPCGLVQVEGAGHGFDFMPEQMDLRPTVFTFFDEHLGAPTTAASRVSIRGYAAPSRSAPAAARMFDLLGRSAGTAQTSAFSLTPNRLVLGAGNPGTSLHLVR